VTRAHIAATLHASGSAPKEDNMLDDQPVAVSREDADAAFLSLYAEHGPTLLRLYTCTPP
jgi:hypothetical protein